MGGRGEGGGGGACSKKKTSSETPGQIVGTPDEEKIQNGGKEFDEEK